MMTRSSRFALLSAVLMMALTVGWAVAQPAREVPYRAAQDLAYDSRFPRQVLDVFLPEDDSRLTEAGYPVVFLIHGGGYVTGSKEVMHPIAEALAAQGYAAVAPNYRLGAYPAPIEDLVCALGWMASVADTYRFDLDRLVLLGESAGGNAAALLGAHDDLAHFVGGCLHPLPAAQPFAAIVSYYMYADMTTCRTGCRLLKQVTAFYLGQPLGSATMDELRDLWGEASPLVWLDGSEPPTLLIHGVEDNIVPVSESEQYASALSDVGVTVETVYLAETGHGFIKDPDVEATQQALTAVLGFLERILSAAD
jgi:acetyl esterase/lipase